MAGVAPFDWDDVRVFLEVAAASSLGEASRALRISEATVGRRLRRLEVALGMRLFDRLANRLRLTAAGNELAQAAAAMRESADALTRRASLRDTDGPRPVRITATSSVALFLATHMGELVKAGSGAGAEIALGSSRTLASLAQGEAEIALRMRRLPEAGALAARRLGRFAFALYASRRRWLAGDTREPWRGLEVIGLAATARAPSQSAWLDAAARGHRATITVRLAEVWMRHRAVQDGLGISLLPCFLGEADRELVRIAEPPAELAEDVHLLVHTDLRRHPPVRAVADAVAALFRRHRAALAGLGADHATLPASGSVRSATGRDEASAPINGPAAPQPLLRRAASARKAAIIRPGSSPA
jgi:DNA-binding transcriptional LysR family regulator